MVGQELQAVDLGVLLQAVQLHTRVVVDVEMPLLGNSKHHLVVEEPRGSEPIPSHLPTSHATMVTHCTSLTVSLTWNSQPRVLLLQSMVATCPSFPPINRCLKRQSQVSAAALTDGLALFQPAVSRVVDAVRSKCIQLQVEELHRVGSQTASSRMHNRLLMAGLPLALLTHMEAVGQRNSGCNILCLNFCVLSIPSASR